MKIIYDITRLYVRRNETTPTGIDRVDIHYVLHLLKSKIEVIFVRGEKRGFKYFSSKPSEAVNSKIG